MNLKKHYSFILLTLFTLLFLFGLKVEANDLSFSVDVILPENQLETTKSYFDLRVTPGQVQDIQVELVNETENPVVLEVSATTAITNNNGMIDYSVLDPQLDSSLQTPFSEIATVVEPEVSLGAKERKKVNIQLAIPEEPFAGILLGGIFVTPKMEESESTGTIMTTQAMVRGVRLSENDDPVVPEVKMIEAKAGQVGYRNVFQATLQNPQPMILEDITIEAAVYKKGNTTDPLFKNRTENIRMAPNSNFDYSVPLNDKLFEAGEYTMELKVTIPDQEWEFSQPLTVTIVQAEKLNTDTTPLPVAKGMKKGWQIFLVIVIVLILIAIVLWWLMKQGKLPGLTKKWKKSSQKVLKKKKKKKVSKKKK